MKILFCAIKGCTAYELQIGIRGRFSLVVRWVHLRGDYWAERPWRRFSAKFYGVEGS